MSNSMRELGGLVDNLYISSQQQRENKSRHPSDLPGMMSKSAAGMSATPSRARKAKVRAGVEGLGVEKPRAGPANSFVFRKACVMSVLQQWQGSLSVFPLSPPLF